MRMWNSRAPLFIAFVVTLATVYGCSAPPGGTTLRSEEDQKLVSTQDDLQTTAPLAGIYDNATESPLKDLIDATNETLDIEIYEMREPTIHEAIKSAISERGVAVRIIIEPQTVGNSCSFASLNADESGEQEYVQATSGSCDEYFGRMNDLKALGATIKPFPKDLCGIEGKNCVQHGKLVVSDRKRAMISTGNFNGSNLCSIAENSSRCNRDFSVIVEDGPSVRALKKVFEHDFIGERYDVQAVLDSEPGHRVTVSPVSQDALFSFLKSAKKSVHLQAQYLKEPNLNSTLTTLAKRGVEVSGAVASVCSFGRITESASKKHADLMRPMEAAGVHFRMFTTLNRIAGKRAYMHSKVFIVDAARAWIGSTNGSSQALYSNREFGIFTDDKSWVSKLAKVVEEDFESEANEDLEDNLTCTKEYGGLAGDR